MFQHLETMKRGAVVAAFAALLLAILSFHLAGFIDSAHLRKSVPHSMWSLTQDEIKIVQAMQWYEAIGRACFIVVALSLGRRLARNDPRFPRHFVLGGVAFLIFEATLRSVNLRYGPPITDSMFASERVAAALWGALIAIGLLWVWCSSLVRVTFGGDAGLARRPPAGPVPRVLLGMLGAVLIAWPFVMNTYVEAPVYLARLLSPQDPYEFGGVALAILAASGISGLYLLMKQTWQMKRGWILVLLPAAFSILAWYFVMMSFGLYFRW